MYLWEEKWMDIDRTENADYSLGKYANRKEKVDGKSTGETESTIFVVSRSLQSLFSSGYALLPFAYVSKQFSEFYFSYLKNLAFSTGRKWRI